MAQIKITVAAGRVVSAETDGKPLIGSVSALAATLPTVKRDLDWVREKHTMGPFGDDDKVPSDIAIKCVACHREIIYSVDYVDTKLSKFICQTMNAFGYPLGGCGLVLSEVQIDQLSDAAIGAVLYTALTIPNDPIYKFVQKSNGLAKYTATEEMSFAERMTYYQKALRERRKKK